MKFSTGTALGAAATAFYATGASAGTATSSPKTGINLQWAVPDTTAKSGSGDIFFQIMADATFQWVGVGIGSGMVGADMFIIYEDGKGNVTLSTRTATAHVMPQHQDQSEVELLAGSGVENGKLVANIRCGSCNGKLDLTGPSGWITAWKSGDPLNSASVEATITEHDDKAVYKVDMSQAAITSDSNPFLGQDSSSSGSSSSSGGSSSGVTLEGEGDSDATSTLFLAHGVIMSAVFLIGYPMGAVLMPLIGKWFIHAAWQSIFLLAMWAAFGIGYTISRQEGEFFSQSHTQLGIFVVALLSLQPVLGFVHHTQYKKSQNRGVFSHIHIWYGRALMILGAVNGGLGMQLANSPKAFIITYCVVAGVSALLYVGITAGKSLRQRKQESIEKGQARPAT